MGISTRPGEPRPVPTIPEGATRSRFVDGSPPIFSAAFLHFPKFQEIPLILSTWSRTTQASTTGIHCTRSLDQNPRVPFPKSTCSFSHQITTPQTLSRPKTLEFPSLFHTPSLRPQILILHAGRSAVCTDTFPKMSNGRSSNCTTPTPGMPKGRYPK